MKMMSISEKRKQASYVNKIPTQCGGTVVWKIRFASTPKVIRLDFNGEKQMKQTDIYLYLSVSTIKVITVFCCPTEWLILVFFLSPIFKIIISHISRLGQYNFSYNLSTNTSVGVKPMANTIADCQKAYWPMCRHKSK